MHKLIPVIIIVVAGVIGTFLIIFSFPEQTGIAIVDLDVPDTTITCSDDGWFWHVDWVVGENQWICLDGVVDGGYGLRSGSEIKQVLDITKDFKSLDGKLVFVEGFYHKNDFAGFGVVQCYVDPTIQGKLIEGYHLPFQTTDWLVDKGFEGYKAPTNKERCELEGSLTSDCFDPVLNRLTSCRIPDPRYTWNEIPSSTQGGFCVPSQNFIDTLRISKLAIKAIDPEIPYVNLTPKLTEGGKSIVAGELRVGITSANVCTNDKGETATLIIYQKYLGTKFKVPFDAKLLQDLCLAC